MIGFSNCHYGSFPFLSFHALHLTTSVVGLLWWGSVSDLLTDLPQGSQGWEGGGSGQWVSMAAAGCCVRGRTDHVCRTHLKWRWEHGWDWRPLWNLLLQSRELQQEVQAGTLIPSVQGKTFGSHTFRFATRVLGTLRRARRDETRFGNVSPAESFMRLPNWKYTHVIWMRSRASSQPASQVAVAGRLLRSRICFSN